MIYRPSHTSSGTPSKSLTSYFHRNKDTNICISSNANHLQHEMRNIQSCFSRYQIHFHMLFSYVRKWIVTSIDLNLNLFLHSTYSAIYFQNKSLKNPHTNFTSYQCVQMRGIWGFELAAQDQNLAPQSLKAHKLFSAYGWSFWPLSILKAEDNSCSRHGAMTLQWSVMECDVTMRNDISLHSINSAAQVLLQ